MIWTWHWLGQPVEASFGDNIVFDWVRVVVIVISGFLIMTIGRILLEQRRRKVGLAPHQLLGFGAYVLAAVSIGLTELTVVGTPATPRLFVHLLAMAAGVQGMRMTRKFQSTLTFKA